MATFTTNYNLKKPDGTDFYNIEDSNSNFDIIDEQLKAAYDAIKDNEGSFKNMGINGVNIDDVFNYSYVVGITDDSYGTRPEQSWIMIQNFYATNFIIQIATKIENGGTANGNRLWIRNRYSSGAWSGWSQIFSKGNPPNISELTDSALYTFKNMNLNNVNIDDTFNYNYVTAISEDGHGTRPATSWLVVMNLYTVHFIVQIAMACVNNGTADNNKMWIRNRYQSGAWSGWSPIYSGGAKPTAADVGAAPKAHATTATTYGIGTSSNYGHVKLSDSTSSTSAASSGIAASPKAVKAAYDLANTASNKVYVQSSQPSSAADNTIWVW